ncbi:MAG: imidazolonepropionase [Dehalococcoidia bacterium]
MTEMLKADRIIVHAASLCQIKDRGGPRRGADQDALDLIDNGAVAIAGERILAAGSTEDVLRSCDVSAAEVYDARGQTVLPGLVEAHSHPVFAGSRYLEYAQRLSGVSIDEIVAAGGGIWNSVLRTREASDDELLTHAVAAFDRMLADGITAVEAKSGYGLTPEQELRTLRLIDAARQRTPLDVIPTFLGAHVVPAGMEADAYVDQICEAMLPAVAEQRIAEFCDVTCEAGYFDARQATRVIERAAEYGLPRRIHADAWTPSGGWPLAAATHARTADHVTFATDEEIRAVGQTDTIAVLLPVAETVYLSRKRVNARLLIEQGVPVAIATDYCSSIPIHSLRAAIGLAAAWFEISPGACIVGATLNAAYSLNRAAEIGSLEAGKQADILVLDCEHPFQFVWELGHTPVRRVYKRGQVVRDASPVERGGARVGPVA